MWDSFRRMLKNILVQMDYKVNQHPITAEVALQAGTTTGLFISKDNTVKRVLPKTQGYQAMLSHTHFWFNVSWVRCFFTWPNANRSVDAH